jgi:hypothetical protein
MKPYIVVSNHVHNLAGVNFSPSREMWKVRVLVPATADIPNPENEDGMPDRVHCPYYTDFVPKGRGSPYFLTENEARSLASSLY